MPSFSAWCAATSDRWTSAPHVTITRSVPSWRRLALPNGIMKSLPGYSPLLYVCRYRCLCSRNITGSSQRIAVRSRPAASMAVDGIRDADPGTVREDALAGLAVIRTAAAQVSADRHANDHRARKRVARPVPQHRHLVAQLHHRRPDVVEELNLDHRLQLANGHADAATDDGRLGERRVEDAILAVRALQAVRHLEDAALAGHDLQGLLPAGVRDVLAEDDDARIVRHLVFQRPVDGGDHRVGLALGVRRRVERRRGRIDVGRVDPERGRFLRRFRRLQGLAGHAPRSRGRRPRRSRPARRRWRGRWREGTPRSRVMGSRRASASRSVGGLVQLLVVGERMRVRADHVRVHERRALARADVRRQPRASRRGWRRNRCRPPRRRAGRETTGQVVRCRRRPSALRPARRWRSRCPRRGRARGSCFVHATLSASQNSPSLVAPSPSDT